MVCVVALRYLLRVVEELDGRWVVKGVRGREREREREGRKWSRVRPGPLGRNSVLASHRSTAAILSPVCFQNEKTSSHCHLLIIIPTVLLSSHCSQCRPREKLGCSLRWPLS